jgi:hypothetical protein
VEEKKEQKEKKEKPFSLPLSVTPPPPLSSLALAAVPRCAGI